MKKRMTRKLSVSLFLLATRGRRRSAGTRAGDEEKALRSAMTTLPPHPLPPRERLPLHLRRLCLLLRLFRWALRPYSSAPPPPGLVRLTGWKQAPALPPPLLRLAPQVLPPLLRTHPTVIRAALAMRLVVVVLLLLVMLLMLLLLLMRMMTMTMAVLLRVLLAATRRARA